MASTEVDNERTVTDSPRQTDEALHEQREWLHVTLSSIGDGVITCDNSGNVTFLNPVAQTLTGWTQDEAVGVPLETVFRIVGEESRRPVENPAVKALREGIVVGLANRTLLISKDGTEHPIGDSAAPIRSKTGDVVGCVLIFQDITERKRAEKELQRSEERWRLALDAGELGAWNIDPSTEVLTSDERFRIIFHGSAAPITYEEAFAAIHPDDRQRIRDGVAAATRPDDPALYAEEYRVIHPDGTVHWVFGKGRASFEQTEAGRRLASFDGTVTDITARKESEKVSRESEAGQAFLVKLADTLRPLSDPIEVQAEASRVLGEHLGANRVAYFELRDRAYTVERNFTDGVPLLVGRYPVGSFSEALLEAYSAGRTVVEADVTTNPGLSAEELAGFLGIQARAYIGVPLVKDGALVAVLAIHMSGPRVWTADEVALAEQTAERTWSAVERARAEEALRASEERYRTLFDTMDEGFCVIEMIYDDAGRPVDYRFIETNRAFEKYSGLRDATGRRMRELAPDHESEWFETYGRVATTGESRRFELEGKALGRWFDVYASRAGEPGSNRVAILFNDMTDRKWAEKERERLVGELQEQDRRKDEFLAMLSHELRNPLAPIANAVQILRLQRNEDSLQQKARAIIERQVGQLKHLIDDLLEVSRITTGRVQLRQELIAVSGIVERAVETARPLIGQRRHELTVTVPPETIWLHADAARLEQVVVNLLTNAAKYTDEGGRIWLTVEQEGDEAVLRVRDTGVGIAPELLPRIFDLFTQADRSLARSEGGLGIGLALAQRLVELHQGRVEVISSLGQGSEFIVRLPTVASLAPPSSLSGETTQPSENSCRVLVVDDNVDSAESLALLLRMSEHGVRTAHDGPAALEAALDFRPDVVLLDIGLPQMNGYEVARKLRQQSAFKNVVLVAMTGYGQESDRQLSQEAGFDHHLVKPADFGKVTQILASVCLRIQEGS